MTNCVNILLLQTTTKTLRVLSVSKLFKMWNHLLRWWRFMLWILMCWGCLWYSQISTLHMVETHFLLENLWISERSLGILKKFQHSSALPCQLYWLFIYASKYIFPYKNIPIDTHTKIWTEITDIVVFREKLLKFLQDVKFILQVGHG